MDYLGKFGFTPKWICFASCWLGIEEYELEAYRDGNFDRLPRVERRKIERRLQKEYKDQLKLMTKAQQKAFKRKVIKRLARERGIELVESRIKKKFGKKIAKKGAAMGGGLLTGPFGEGVALIYSLVTGIGDIVEICVCSAKCVTK